MQVRRLFRRGSAFDFVGFFLIFCGPYRRSQYLSKLLKPKGDPIFRSEPDDGVHTAVHNVCTGGHFHAPESELSTPSRNSQSRLLLAQTPAPVPERPGRCRLSTIRRKAIAGSQTTNASSCLAARRRGSKVDSDSVDGNPAALRPLWFPSPTTMLNQEMERTRTSRR